MQEGSKNVLKIILYIFIGAAFATSLYFSYLYYKNSPSQSQIPAEVQEYINAERIAVSGVVKSVNNSGINIEQFDDKGNIDIKFDDKTKFSKISFGKSEPEEAKLEDVKDGQNATISARKNPDGSWSAEFVEVIINE